MFLFFLLISLFAVCNSVDQLTYNHYSGMASWLWKPCLQQLGANPHSLKSTRSSSQRSVPLVFVRNPKPNLGNRISCLSKDNDSFGNNQSDRTGLQIYRDIERSVCLLSFLKFVFSGYIYIYVCVWLDFVLVFVVVFFFFLQFLYGLIDQLVFGDNRFSILSNTNEILCEQKCLDVQLILSEILSTTSWNFVWN